MKMASDEEIRRVVAATLAAGFAHRDEVLEGIIQRAISQALTAIGLDVKDQQEIRNDMIHLRRWRKSVEQVHNYTVRAVITVIVAGICGALWLGVKVFLSIKS
jgi:hypothetical protein